MEIVEVFDECLEQILEGRQTVEGCLAQYPELKDELESLLTVALAVRRAAPASLAPQATSRMRSNLQAAIANKQSKPLPKLRLLQSVVIRLAAALMVASSIGGGVMVAAASSLPDAPLYPVKQAVERVQLMMVGDAEQKAELHLTFAKRRLQEAQSLPDAAAAQEIPTIQSLSHETQQAIDALDKLPEAKKASLAEKIATLETRQQQVLTEVLEKVPESAQPGVQSAIERSKRGHERAMEILESTNEPAVKPSESTKRETDDDRRDVPIIVSSPTSTLVSQPTSTPNKVDDNRHGEHGKREGNQIEEDHTPTSVPTITPQQFVTSPVPTLVSPSTPTPAKADDGKTDSHSRDNSRESEPRATAAPMPAVGPTPQPMLPPKKGDDNKAKDQEKRGDSYNKDKGDD